MKKSILIVIFILILLFLGIIIYFVANKTQLNLKEIIDKKDPATNKNPVELIADSDYEGLERAGVTGKENELIIDFMIEAIGLYDWEKIDNAWQELLDAGVTKEDVLLFINKFTELARNNNFDELNKIGVTDEKIQLYINNWDQEKAEEFVKNTVEDTLKKGEEEMSKRKEDLINNLP